MSEESTSPAQFGRQLDAFARQTDLDHSELCVRFALLVGGKIVARTPFLTGRARASWNGSFHDAKGAQAIRVRRPCCRHAAVSK